MNNEEKPFDFQRLVNLGTQYNKHMGEIVNSLNPNCFIPSTMREFELTFNVLNTLPDDVAADFLYYFNRRHSVPSDQIKRILKFHDGGYVMHVFFIKKDGTVRNMLATNSADLIPSEMLPKGIREGSDDNLRVFDLIEGDWRSFNFDQVITLKTVPVEQLENLKNVYHIGNEILEMFTDFPEDEIPTCIEALG